jgi:hypothetical protein
MPVFRDGSICCIDDLRRRLSPKTGFAIGSYPVIHNVVHRTSDCPLSQDKKGNYAKTVAFETG